MSWMWMWISWGIVGLILAISICFDVRQRRIPNVVTLPAIVVGVSVMAVSAWFRHRPETLMAYFFALTLAVIFCMGMERGGIWAAGDSKLFLAILSWIAVVVPPIEAVGLMMGLTALLHIGIVMIRRCSRSRHDRRSWWMAWALLLPLGQASQYPGAVLIAVASLLIFLLSGLLWRVTG